MLFVDKFLLFSHLHTFKKSIKTFFIGKYFSFRVIFKKKDFHLELIFCIETKAQIHLGEKNQCVLFFHT